MVGLLLVDVLDCFLVVCLCIFGVGSEEDLGWLVDFVCEIVYVCDVVVVIDDYVELVCCYGFDGVYLIDGVCSVCYVCKEFGVDVIVGVFCGILCYDGMNVVEVGVDYVSFGFCCVIVFGYGDIVELDLFQWWFEMIEVLVVVEGVLMFVLIGQFVFISDFIVFGGEIWVEDDLVEVLGNFWC